MLFKIFVKITGNKFVEKHILERLIKDLLFNSLISLTIEGFFELIIYAILNIYTRDFSLNGEKLGFCIASFSLFCGIIFVPAALVWAISTKDEVQLDKK